MRFFLQIYREDDPINIDVMVKGSYCRQTRGEPATYPSVEVLSAETLDGKSVDLTDREMDIITDEALNIYMEENS